jgi:hypothetical protein
MLKRKQKKLLNEHLLVDSVEWSSESSMVKDTSSLEEYISA